MIVRCRNCGVYYDDFVSLNTCPHEEPYSPSDFGIWSLVVAGLLVIGLVLSVFCVTQLIAWLFGG